MTEFDELVDHLAQETRKFIEERLADVIAKQAIEIAELRSRAPIKGDPGDPGKDAAVDYDRLGSMLKAMVDALRVPNDGDPGPPGGKGADAVVDYDRIGETIACAVAKEVGKIPAANDGAPGVAAEVDYARVAEMIKAAVVLPVVDYDKVDALIGASVSKAATALPKAADGLPGKDAAIDYGHIAEIIKAAAITAVAELPKPQDGKDADPEFLRAEVEREVKAAVASMPKAKDGDPGKDADVEAITTRVLATVEAKFAEIRVPKDGDPGAPGKDADEAAIVERVLQAIPAPKDGESVDPAAVATMVEDAVAKSFAAMPPVRDGKDADEPAIVARLMTALEEKVAAIPAPKDGESVDPAAVATMVEDAVAKSFAAMPPVRDGKDADEPAIVARLMTALEEKVAAIPAPKDGADGHDALAAAIVRGIDEGRSYPPNTYAAHRGAFMVSERQTSPVGADGLKAAGWLILSDGVALQDVEQDAADPRSFKFRQVLASGIAIEKSFYVPSVIDRNVWYDGMEANAGDLVTCKGDGWIARRRNKSRPGAVPEDWRLTYKR